MSGADLSAEVWRAAWQYFTPAELDILIHVVEKGTHVYIPGGPGFHTNPWLLEKLAALRAQASGAQETMPEPAPPSPKHVKVQK